ncbi:G-protein coupled receptor moody [Holothuria leucospilota]|uniref:G-protein coupled receptor moody n=1 Tax=Holothuria leucospilota TaxID=206669 RepID=A0A9Q1BTK3_HOLLE|nr:G-protein coupled receptor moody [Holothuria leucospilota]
MEATQDFNNERYRIPDNTDAFFLGLLSVYIFLVGVPGNTLILLAVLFSRKLQTTSNAFIVNLAIADLFACLVQPLHMVGTWANYYSSSLDSMCLVASCISHLCIACSIFTLAAIAFNRFVLVVCSSSTYQSIYRSKFLKIWIPLLWTLAVLMTLLPPLALDIGKFGFDNNTHTCRSIIDYPTADQYDSIIVFGVYPLPFFIIIVCYSGILLTVIKHDRRLKKRKTEMSVISSDDPIQRSATVLTKTITKQLSVTSMEIRVTANMFIIFCAFIVCTTPLFICTIYQCLIMPYVRTVLAINSTLNPLIYGVNHPIFRSVFTSFLKCKPVPEPSNFLIGLRRRIYALRES